MRALAGFAALLIALPAVAQETPVQPRKPATGVERNAAAANKARPAPVRKGRPAPQVAQAKITITMPQKGGTVTFDCKTRECVEATAPLIQRLLR